MTTPFSPSGAIVAVADTDGAWVGQRVHFRGHPESLLNGLRHLVTITPGGVDEALRRLPLNNWRALDLLGATWDDFAALTIYPVLTGDNWLTGIAEGSELHTEWVYMFVPGSDGAWTVCLSDTTAGGAIVGDLGEVLDEKNGAAAVERLLEGLAIANGA